MRYRSALSCGLLIAALLCLFGPGGAAAGTRRPDTTYVPGEVLVKLNPSVDPRKFAHATGLRDGDVSIKRLGTRPIYRFQIADHDSPSRKAAKLSQYSLVQYAEPNYQGQLPEARLRSSWVVGGDTNDYTAQWAQAKMHLSEAHAISRGAGVIVAILDTGIDASHPALAGHLTDGYDFVASDADPSEEGIYGVNGAYGHGTHVAGLVALAAPDAMLMPLRTLDIDGIGTIWGQLEGLSYAIEHGADVVNLSYSFSQPSLLMNDLLADLTCANGVELDCRQPTRPGLIVVAAAGNSGGSDREYPAAANMPGVLAMAASTDADTTAVFSTYGSWVRVMAPGDHILSTIPGGGFATWSGTSMSTPLAAGTAALLRAICPLLRPSEIANQIATTATPTGSTVRRRVDATSALVLTLAKQTK
jgi:subtilisin family serine protease